MIKLCEFCGKQITRESLNSPNISWKIKYCSDACNKRAYYKRNMPKKSKSIFKDKSEWFKTETGKGYLWERFVADLVGGEWQGFGGPTDVIWNGFKIDVKVANLYKRKMKRGKPVNPNTQSGWFVFDKHSEKAEIDYLFCIGLVNEVPVKMWFIPYESVGKSFTITINKSKKYDKWLFNDVLDR